MSGNVIGGFEKPIGELVAYFSELRTDDGQPAVSLAGLHAEMMEDLGDLGDGHRLPTLDDLRALASGRDAACPAALQVHTYLWRCYWRTVSAEWTPAPSWLATPPTVAYARKGWHVYRPRSGERVI